MGGENLYGLVIIITIIAHLPAIVMMIIGLALRKSKPNASKTLIIISTVYFIIGLGICGLMIA